MQNAPFNFALPRELSRKDKPAICSTKKQAIDIHTNSLGGICRFQTLTRDIEYDIICGGGDELQIEKSSQAKKYLKNLDKPAREKLELAIERLKKGEGDIIKLKGCNLYRLKTPPFRIGFTLDYETDVIKVILIRPRGDFYKHI